LPIVDPHNPLIALSSSSSSDSERGRYLSFFSPGIDCRADRKSIPPVFLNSLAGNRLRCDGGAFPGARRGQCRPPNRIRENRCPLPRNGFRRYERSRNIFRLTPFRKSLPCAS
jgi:hypothetical protein